MAEAEWAHVASLPAGDFVSKVIQWLQPLSNAEVDKKQSGDHKAHVRQDHPCKNLGNRAFSLARRLCNNNARWSKRGVDFVCHLADLLPTQNRIGGTQMTMRICREVGEQVDISKQKPLIRPIHRQKF